EALRDKDPQALSAIAEAYGPSMPDLAGRCTALAARFGAQGTRSEAGREGRGELTARERQISALIVAGRSNAEIARELGVRVRTEYRLLREFGHERVRTQGYGQ